MEKKKKDVYKVKPLTDAKKISLLLSFRSITLKQRRTSKRLYVIYLVEPSNP
ncbi:hypothetical protein F350042L8_34050 [Fusobacterium ulcerans]|uniref:hypothetical protein n=1 Tax=Fusobacterium ulcerans TaxID=861 RepID=UPI0034A89D4F